MLTNLNLTFFLRANNIPTPPSSLILSHESISTAAQNVGGFPCIIKKTTGGNGKLVDIVNNKSACLKFILNAKQNISSQSIFPRSFSFLLQQPITESFGTDYRALCIKDQLIGIMKRTSQNNSFKANVSLGGAAEFVDTIPEIESISKEVMKKSNLFMSGIDFIKGGTGYQVIEINTSPQFKGFEQATKINIADHIIKALLKN